MLMNTKNQSSYKKTMSGLTMVDVAVGFIFSY